MLEAVLRYGAQFVRWNKDVRWTCYHPLLCLADPDRLEWIHYEGDPGLPSKSDPTWRDVWPWITFSLDQPEEIEDVGFIFVLFRVPGEIWMTWFPKSGATIAARVGDGDVEFSAVMWSPFCPWRLWPMRVVKLAGEPVAEVNLPANVTKV